MKSDDAQSQNRRGRPATGTNASIGVRMTEANILKVDRWRSLQVDVPSRPEAIRRLVELGLEAAKVPDSTN